MSCFIKKWDDGRGPKEERFVSMFLECTVAVMYTYWVPLGAHLSQMRNGGGALGVKGGWSWQTSRLCSVVVSSVCVWYLTLFLLRYIRWLRWSSDSHAGLWFPNLGVQTRPKPLDFFCVKKSSVCLPPEGKLNNLSHVLTLRHVKEPSSCGKLRIASKIPAIKSSLLR
jgi:hypothetical protein